MPVVVRTIALGAAVMAIQWLFLGRLTLWGAYPDAVLLYVTVIGIRYGRQSGAIAGFGVGFLMDAIYDTWGLHMLVKTLVGFLVGFFPSADRETVIILPRQAFLGGLVIALVHNGLFVTLLALQAGVRNTFLVTGLWLGSAVYTACVATLVSFFGTK
ncbi:MAG: rod shape-determining protein MreD [Bacteroidetes bacterium]|nr:rod shape-determining protein MreD [Bacteroidota bacterium]MCH8245588.1 rod shape-determining protein MreD [Bacteroidota bacterium]